jgi:hypothetical protein
MATQTSSIKRYVVKLSGEERAQLEALIRKGKSPAQRLLKARILLKADGVSAISCQIAFLYHVLMRFSCRLSRNDTHAGAPDLGERVRMAVNTGSHRPYCHRVQAGVFTRCSGR